MLTISVRPEPHVDELWNSPYAPSCNKKLTTLACALLEDLSVTTTSLLGSCLGDLAWQVFTPMHEPNWEHLGQKRVMIVPAVLSTILPNIQAAFHLSTQWRAYPTGMKQITLLAVHLLNVTTLLYGSAFTPLTSRINDSLPQPLQVACSTMELAIPVFVLLRAYTFFQKGSPTRRETGWEEITKRVLLFLNAMHRKDPSWGSFLGSLRECEGEAYQRGRALVFACALRFTALPDSLTLSEEEHELQKYVQKLAPEKFTSLLAHLRNGRMTNTLRVKNIRNRSFYYLPMTCRPYDRGIQAWVQEARRTPCERITQKAKECAKKLALFVRGLVTFPWVQPILHPRIREEQ